MSEITIWFLNTFLVKFLSIGDLDKHNLAWWFGFRLAPLLDNDQTLPENCFQKLLKINHLANLTKVESKSLIHTVFSNEKYVIMLLRI